ncbi:MAG: hypothetical protein M9935_11625 [Kiritimatiellae bacterium]|nr:hypothetical protein [Kiritimatiellia bacterium]
MRATLLRAILTASLFAGAASYADNSELTPFRTAGGQFGFVVPAMSSPAGLRIFVDADGPAHGFSASGFDFMAEGASVFRYPEGAADWRWDNEGSVIFAVRGNEMAMVLPNVNAAGTLRWRAEWYDGQWQVTRHVPAQGLIESEAASLPDAPSWLDPKVPSIAELKAFSPITLSRRAVRDYIEGDWTALASVPPLPSVTIPGDKRTAQVALRWTDPRTGKQTDLEPQEAMRDTERIRWSGEAPDGSTWWLVAPQRSADVLDVVAIVRSQAESCFRLSIGVRYPAGDWTWYDDVQFSTPLQKNVRARFDGTSPYGLNQRRSYYPFGVIASTAAVVAAETDGREPRHFQIEADSGESTLWIHYDLAATPKTEHFPGLATVHAQFRASPRLDAHPFRDELRSWFARDPEWTHSRAPVHGLWMPFTDIGSVSNPADFGFAYFEKVGALGADVDAARANGALTLVYTEPWLYWLPLPAAADWNRDAAERRMEQLARTSVGKEREFASAGILGVTRDADLQPRIQFMATPWSTGGRMEVNTDPELPVTSSATVNRAMAEWRFIRESLDDPRTDGIYLDSMSAMETMDYNPAAIAVADFPLTFVQADLKPGIAMPISAVEFTAALAGYLHAHGKYLMGNFPMWKFPFFMPYIDIPGEETTWYSGKRYVPLSERERNYRRAMSGAKPFGFLQATHFSDLSPADMEKYFRDCLAQGFLPSFFSHDGANDPYWVDAKLYERDRPLFRHYMPLIIRLSAAGWQPVPGAVASDERILVEQFGVATNDAIWLTLRNTSGASAVNTVTLREELKGRVLYDIQTGRVLSPGEPLPPVELASSEVRVWLALAPEAVGREATWFRSAADHHPLYEAGSINLASYEREREAGVRAPSPLAAKEGEWTRVKWQVSVAGKHVECERMLFQPPSEILAWSGPGARVVANAGVASLLFSASNRSAHAQTVVLKWGTGAATTAIERAIAPGEAIEESISVEAQGARSRRVIAQWVHNGIVKAEYESYTLFVAPLQHVGMKPGVRVTADSAYSGYTTIPLNDGETESAGLMWNEGAFASAETAEPHWVRYQFSAPKRVSSATAYWNEEGGVLYASRRGEVWGQTEEGTWTLLGSVSEAGTNARTRVAFEPTPVTAIEWRQPPSSGSVARPDILWLVELEVQ